jgi:hypothetical protein
MKILTAILILILQTQVSGQVHFQQFFNCEDVKLMQESEHAMFIKKRPLSPISVYEFLDVLQATSSQCRDSLFDMTMALTQSQKAFLEDSKRIRLSPITVSGCRINGDLYFWAIYEYLLQRCMTSQFSSLDSLVKSVSWSSMPVQRRSQLAKAFYLVMGDLYFDSESFDLLDDFLDRKDSIYQWSTDWNLLLPSDWRKEILFYFKNGYIIEGNMLFYYYYWNRSSAIQREWGQSEKDKEIEDVIQNFGFAPTRYQLENLNKYKIVSGSDGSLWYQNLELNPASDVEEDNQLPTYILIASTLFWVILSVFFLFKIRSLTTRVKMMRLEDSALQAADDIASKVGINIILIFLFVTTSEFAHGQSSEKQFMAWDSLNKKMRDSSVTEGYKYARAYFEKAVELKDSMKIVKGGRMLTYSLMDMPEMSKSIEILKNLNLIVEELKKRNNYPIDQLLSSQAAILNNLGICYMNVGDFPSSMKSLLKSLEIKKQRKDTVAIINAISNIGLGYHQFGIDKRSDEIYRQGVDLLEKYQNKEVFKGTITISYLYSNYAVVKLSIGDYESALKYALKGLDYSEGLSYKHVNTAYLVYANSLIYLGKKEEAKEALKKVLLKSEDVRQQGEYYGLKAELVEPGSDSAFWYLKKSYELKQQSEIDILRRLSMKGLLQAYRLRGDSNNAQLLARKLTQHNDSIFNQQLLRNIKWIDKSYMDAVKASKRSKGSFQQFLIENKPFLLINLLGLIFFLVSIFFYLRLRRSSLNITEHGKRQASYSI